MKYNIKLYDFPTSSCSSKVRVTLAEKGLPWTNKIINLLRFEQLTPDYMRLNPEGVVPTLIFDGQVVCNSPNIVKFIEEKVPTPSLTPTDPELQHVMNTWFDKAENFKLREFTMSRKNVLLLKYMEKNLLPEKIPLLKKLQQQTDNEQLKQEYEKRIIDMQHVFSIINDPKQVKKLEQQATQLIIDLNQQLENKDYICGEQFTLADVMWMIVLHRFDFLHWNKLWKYGQNQNVARYYKSLKKRKSFHLGITRYFKPWVMLPLVVSTKLFGPAKSTYKVQ